MISNQYTATKEGNLPGWSTIFLKSLPFNFSSSPSVLMGDYLIILVRDMMKMPKKATLLAVDLRDYSVQETEIEDDALSSYYVLLSTKFQENQMVIVLHSDYSIQDMITITIRSFKRYTFLQFLSLTHHPAFEVEFSTCSLKNYEIRSERFEYTAQIYQDFLYVYYCRSTEEVLTEDFKGELWKFHLIKHQWELCEMFGQSPELFDQLSSFVFQDKLYVYEGKFRDSDEITRKNFYVLNFGSMTWEILENSNFFMEKVASLGAVNVHIGDNFGGDLFNNHFIFSREISFKEALYCWDINNNSWSTFDIQRRNLYSTGGFVVYKNFLLISRKMYVDNNLDNIAIALDFFNLEHVGLAIREPREFESLFMNEEESDIAFKVQDKIFPAHKRVLIERSRYFANLFKSGMAETRQKMIEIEDCESSVFKEFLRGIYCEQIHLSITSAFKVFAFADKYLQDELKEQSWIYLMQRTNSNNVFRFLDFACQENLPYFKKHCLNFLSEQIDESNVPELLEYLNKQSLDFLYESPDLRSKALTLATFYFLNFSQENKPNRKLYEDFLIRNIDPDTIFCMANFICAPHEHIPPQDPNKDMTIAKFHKEIENLTTAVFGFVQKNLRVLKQQKITDKLPREFFVYMLFHMTGTSNNDA